MKIYMIILTTAFLAIPLNNNCSEPSAPAGLTPIKMLVSEILNSKASNNTKVDRLGILHNSKELSPSEKKHVEQTIYAKFGPEEAMRFFNTSLFKGSLTLTDPTIWLEDKPERYLRRPIRYTTRLTLDQYNAILPKSLKSIFGKSLE